MNYYDLLEVLPSASQEVIHMAYKAQIRKYHPDLYCGDKAFAEEKTKQLNKAYSILSSPDLRSAYDEMLRENQQKAHTAGFGQQHQATSSHQPNSQPNVSYSGATTDKAASKAKRPYVVITMISLLIIIGAVAIGSIFLKPQESATEIYNLVAPSVVEITAESEEEISTGTGFFVDSQGTIVTNYHVIEGCTSASITLSDGNSFSVTRVLGYDATNDIAILETSCKISKPLKIRKTAVTTGEKVYAVGSSLGLSGTLSDGIISSAERVIDGIKYIQTTAPISHGNSGGPLLDANGNVVGITSASFVDGQNLNLAIPIAMVDLISTKHPTTLVELFGSNNDYPSGHPGANDPPYDSMYSPVEYMSDWAIQYEEEENCFILFFMLQDSNEVSTHSVGTISMEIVNDAGVSVYNASYEFHEGDFGYWSNRNWQDDKYLASIYIDIDAITPGVSSEGTITFVVSGADYYFDETMLSVYDLPIAPVHLELPNLPITVNYCRYDGSTNTTARIDSIRYEIMYGDSLYIYFSGEKTYDYDGAKSDTYCVFKWKLYDSEGYLIDSGTVFTKSLGTGDKFKDEVAYVFSDIVPGESYTLVVSDYE